GGPTVSVEYTPPRTVNNGQSPTLAVEIWCRAALFNGKVSSFALATFRPEIMPILPNDRVEANVRFDAIAQSKLAFVGDQKERDCREHDPGGGGGGTTSNICLHISPSAGSKEYRVYRRVDDGPLGLLGQGAVTNIATGLDVCENAMPVNGGTLCFYVQL